MVETVRNSMNETSTPPMITTCPNGGKVELLPEHEIPDARDGRTIPSPDQIA